MHKFSMSWCYWSLQGRFEIISLSGSFLLSENNGSRSRTGGLSVSLAGSDGRVLGGGVAGMLTAATPVQVLLYFFFSSNLCFIYEFMMKYSLSAHLVKCMKWILCTDVGAPINVQTSGELTKIQIHFTFLF